MSTYGNGQSLSHKSYLKTKRNKRNVSRRLRIEIAFRQSYRCQICDRFPIPPTFEVDHIHELQDGGLDRADNLSVFFFFVQVVSFRVHAGTMCAHGYVVETLTRSLFQFFTTSHTPLLQPSGLFGLPPGKDVPERVRARPNVSATATLETATLETTGSQIHGWIKSSYHSRTRF